MGVPIHTASSVTGEGSDEIYQYIDSGKTIVFLESFAIGKSTLINRPAGEEIIIDRNRNILKRFCFYKNMWYNIVVQELLILNISFIKNNGIKPMYVSKVKTVYASKHYDLEILPEGCF